jgi:hypothetical protein
MPLTQQQQEEFLKFLNLEEAEDLEKAKATFQEKFIPAEEHKSKIGAITGKISTTAKRAFEPFGVKLSDEDFKEKKIEEVLASASEKAKATFEEQKQEWEKRASATGSDELVKEWEKKYKQVEKKATEAEQLRLDAISQFEKFKEEVQTKERNGKIENVFQSAFQTIKLDPTVNDLTKRGFRDTVLEKYILDLEETGDVVVKDKKSGERIKSGQKAGQFMTINDVLLKEATDAGIIQKNPAAGNPAARNNAAFTPTSNPSERKPKVHPAFMGQ